MSAKRRARHSKRRNKVSANPSIGANHHNFKHHRKLIPNLKFKSVPIVEIDVIDGAQCITTNNFIDKVSEYSKRPDIIESGGFFIMRPKSRQKHRYLIDPQKINHWNLQKHSDKHYFINNAQHNSDSSTPYNNDWVYDIPQLSKTVDGSPLLVGSFPQRTSDVLTPLFTAQSQNTDTKQHQNQDSSCVHNSNNKHEAARKRKRNENEHNHNKRRKRRKLQDKHDPNKIAFTLPKSLTLTKKDTLFDLTAHISIDDLQKWKSRKKESVDLFMNGFYDTCYGSNDSDSNDSGSHSFPTSTSSSFSGSVYMQQYNEDEILSTNCVPIEQHQEAFDVLLWNQLLSKRATTQPLTICDMAIDEEDYDDDDIPSLIPSTNSPPLRNMTPNTIISCCFDKDIIKERKAVSTTIGMNVTNDLRGFAFIVNQFDAKHITIDEFWTPNEFEETLLHSPYDDVSAEQIPLIFASHIIGDNVTARCYGVIGDNVTVYEEKSPLDLIDLSLYGPFAEFKEGGRDNEYTDGVHTPYIYLGNTSTWFSWHREDMNLYAVNHLLWGSDKIWYCIAPQSTQRVLEYVRAQYNVTDINVNACWTPLQHKQFWFDPYIMLSMGIDVYFMRQKAGDIMITPPGGLHCGLNAGPNMAESLNFMTYDMRCWEICVSAMHFALFNACQACLNSVWINFNQLAQRCRSSKKCDGKLMKYAPNEEIVAWYQEESMPESICMSLTNKQRQMKRKRDPISKVEGEKLWIYPVKRADAKYWYPAIWIEACYSWDSLLFELLYTFKYLDSGTIKGRNEPEMFTQKDVLWDCGLLIKDWNRTQRFKPLTKKERKSRTKKYSYPRRQGNMIINYVNILNKDYKNMYYKKCVYYQEFPQEIKYKDWHKKKNITFRSHAQMVQDIDKQHLYFSQPLIATVTEEEEDDDDDDIEYL